MANWVGEHSNSIALTTDPPRLNLLLEPSLVEASPDPHSLVAVAAAPVKRLSEFAIVGGFPKRMFDLVVACASIVLLLPTLVLIAAIIKVIDGGPVLFRHSRIGCGGRPFACLKFRTMVNDSDGILSWHLAVNSLAAEEWEESHKLKNDPRLTTLGVMLRKTSLDELPQLFNILKGDMSFVGPRPIVAAEIPRYGRYISDYLRARPGLTGAWQISGRNDVSYETRVMLDRDYVQNWRFARDLVIMMRTVGVVIRRSGCY
jgi:exopolysaccharide production protein ExoY